MRFLVPFCLLILVGIGPAWGQEPSELSEAQPPADVLAQLPGRAISLTYSEYPIGPNHQKVLIHGYAIPYGDRPKSDGGGPYRREDYHLYGVPKSHYTADFFIREGNTLRRVNRVSFEEDDSITGIQLRWLEPKAKRMPIVALHIGGSHWLGWQLIIFPKGVDGPVTRQRFLFGGEGDTHNSVELNRVDRRGKMIVREAWSEANADGVKWYPWDGVEFADRYRPYFIIAASVKSRAEADAFQQRHRYLGDGAVRPSGHYPKLTHGHYIVIVSRHNSWKEAEDVVKDLRKSGVDCYVKRAF